MVLQQKTTTINLRISPLIKTKLVEQASFTGMTLSEMVETACVDFLKSDEEKRKCHIENENYKKKLETAQRMLDLYTGNSRMKTLFEKLRHKHIEYTSYNNVRKTIFINSPDDVYTMMLEIMEVKEI